MATSHHPTNNNNNISPRTTRQSCCWPSLHIGLLPPWAEDGDHLDEKNVHGDDIDEIGKGIVIIMMMMRLPIRKYDDDDDEESTQSSVLPTHDRLPPANWPFRGAFLGKWGSWWCFVASGIVPRNQGKGKFSSSQERRWITSQDSMKKTAFVHPVKNVTS